MWRIGVTGKSSQWQNKCRNSPACVLLLQTEEVTNTSVTLEERLLLPGHRYEARVRARVSMGQWSDWGPPVAWRTQEGESKEALRT